MGRFVFNPEYRYSTPGEYRIGQLMQDNRGREWLHVRATNAAIAKHAFVATNLDTGTAYESGRHAANTGIGRPCGVATAPFAANQYGWILVRGRYGVKTASGAAANIGLHLTGSAGSNNGILDDGGSGNSVVGVYAYDTRRTSANAIDDEDGTGVVAPENTSPCWLDRPYIENNV